MLTSASVLSCSLLLLLVVHLSDSAAVARSSNRCRNSCPYGYKKIFGCQTCRCIDPCENLKCEWWEKCQIENGIQCITTPCPSSPTAVCVPKCKYAVKCSNPCPYGFRMLEDGCSTCECMTACESQKCKPNEYCTLQDVVCVRAPCNPVPVCQPKPVCPYDDSLRCRSCPYGYAKDEKGCNTCDCLNSCEVMLCVQGTKCQYKEIECIKAPCEPQGECVPNPECGPVCAIYCEYGNVLDDKGCPTCKCNDDPNDPCTGYGCQEGQHCEVLNVECKKAPCDPVPQCVANAVSSTVAPQCENLCSDDGLPVCAYDGTTYQSFDSKCALDTYNCKNGANLWISGPGKCDGQCGPVCDIFCREDYMYVYNRNGCRICDCFDPCDATSEHGKQCAAGETCVGYAVQCVVAPCYPQADCVAGCDTICTQDYEPVCGSNGRTYTNKCTLDVENCTRKPPVDLAYNGACTSTTTAGCPIGCPRNLAPVCGSDGNTYSNQCMLDSYNCENNADVVVASQGECQIDCPDICDIYCPFGNVLDSQQCPTCACINPCDGFVCASNQQCVYQGSHCPMCPDQPTCTSRCNLAVDCFMAPGVVNPCAYGIIQDDHTCMNLTCSCVDPCWEVNCSESEHCQIENNGQPFCVPINTVPITTQIF